MKFKGHRQGERMEPSCSEYTAPRFEELRRAALAAPAERGDWEEPCQFLMDAIKDGHPWFHMYRAHPEQYEIEADLAEGLWAISHKANIQRWHHLRLVRRFYFRRSAFGMACSVNRLLCGAGEGNVVWLYKDIVLIRAALALLLGYALVFGAGTTSDVLRLLAHKPHWLWFPVGSLALLGFLIYVNARNQTGRGKHQHLLLRTGGVTAGTVAWAAVYCWLASLVFCQIGWRFDPSEVAMVSAAAVPLSILAQFLFGSERSLTDPL